MQNENKNLIKVDKPQKLKNREKNNKISERK